jgi:GAF domain-containing protein
LTTLENPNVYHNNIVGATPNPLIPNPDHIDEAFAAAANDTLRRAAEVARLMIGTHQAAIAIIVQGDWSSVRKYFSLSEKYAEWANYNTPATGYGIHGWLPQQNSVIRMTQAELEAHPEWKSFGTEQGKHPPMRGWLAAPLVDSAGVSWGLFQLSDKYEGDFTEQDEHNFVELTALVSTALEALWHVRNFRKQMQN